MGKMRMVQALRVVLPLGLVATLGAGSACSSTSNLPGRSDGTGGDADADTDDETAGTGTNGATAGASTGGATGGTSTGGASPGTSGAATALGGTSGAGGTGGNAGDVGAGASESGGLGAAGGGGELPVGGAPPVAPAECVDGTSRSCSAAPLSKLGSCALATAICEDGEWVGCPDPVGEDTCDPGNDDNCNGLPNEGCECTEGETQSCGDEAVGNCTPGTSTCTDNAWGPCVGGVGPAPRDCSSSDDNDCDGNPDNTTDDVCRCAVGEEQNCEAHPGFDGNGPCQAGTQSCELAADHASSDWGACTGSVGPADADSCDSAGDDSNCNDVPNEGCPCVNGETQDCGHATVGICRSGTSTCVDEAYGPCVGSVDPAPRDCSSSADNDCDGHPDNTTDAVCQCRAGESQSCNAHPGYDGNGPCHAGNQSCVLAADKTSSHWGTCSGAVGPAAADTCDAGNDANCNGVPNDGCSCVNGTPQTCACSATVTCTNGTMPACAVSPVLRYRDGDNDGYGNRNNSSQVCPSDLGWVADNNDCDDNNPTMIPGAAFCASDQVTRQWCPATGGVAGSEPCPDGCYDGECRDDGTIGVPGIVSCTSTHVTRCAAADGCDMKLGSCGGTGNYIYHCDAKSDCPSGQKCWHWSYSGIDETKCSASPPTTSYKEVCDPLNNTCNCVAHGSIPIYTCQ